MEVKLNWTHIDILVQIFCSKLKGNFTMKDLAKCANRSSNDPYIVMLKKVLIKEGILNYSGQIGPTSLFTIDNTKLDKFIRESYYFDRIGQHIIKSKPFDYNF